MSVCIENGIGNTADAAAFASACAANKIPYQFAKVVPFTREIVYTEKRPSLWFGSVEFIHAARRLGGVRGIYYGTEFTVEHAQEYADVPLFNCFEFWELQELASVKEDLFFVKPNDDKKQFDGTVLSKDQIERFVADLYRRGFRRDMLVCVSDVKKPPLSEHRVWVVAGNIVAATQYKVDGNICVEDAPGSVYTFALSCAEDFAPSDKGYVIDVAIDTKTGEHTVLEYGCINCAGLYGIDPKPIVHALWKVSRKDPQ